MFKVDYMKSPFKGQNSAELCNNESPGSEVLGISPLKQSNFHATSSL